MTVGDLSPTLLERYLAAARKVSRLALGRPPRSPGGESITFSGPILRKSSTLKSCRSVPVAGRLSTTPFLSMRYDIQIRLTRDRNEHVEGLREPHLQEVELMLDGERVQLFTVVPPAAGKDHSLVDKDLSARVPVKAGPHVVVVAFPGEAANCHYSKQSVNLGKHISIWTGILGFSRPSIQSL